MVWSSHRLRWGYVCSNCGSNRDTGKRVFVVNAPGSGLGPAGGGSPCSNAEYISMKRELLERNSQRDNLMLKVKDLTENHKKYKERLESLHQQESSRQQQVQVLEKTAATRLSDRDHLIASLQGVIEDHERTIQQLETRLYGSSSSSSSSSAPHATTSTVSVAPTSSPFVSASASQVSAAPADPQSSSLPPPGGEGAPPSSRLGPGGVTARLVADIRALHEEKAQLVSQLAEAQGQVEVCQLEHVQKMGDLQRSLAERDKALQLLQETNKENISQAATRDTGSCSTDTEKQLEKVQAEKRSLAAEVSSLHRFYTRNPSLSFSPEAERLRRLEEENGELRLKLTTCQAALTQGEREWTEREGELRARLDAVLTDKQSLDRQLGHLQQDRMLTMTDSPATCPPRAELTVKEGVSGTHTEQLRQLHAKWTTLQAKDPDVITKMVQMEVESESLRTQVADMESQLEKWETRCLERDRTVADLHKQIEHVSDQARKGEEEKELLRTCLLEEVEKERQSKELAVSDARRHLEREMYDLRIANQKMRLTAAQFQASFEGVKQAYQLLAREARQFPQAVSVVAKDLQQQVGRAVQHVAEENKDLVRKYHKEMRLRKKYHNELVELKGNIRVLCRVRPPIKEDGTGSQADNVVTYDPDDDGLIYVSNKGRIQTFEFDCVFSASSTQTQVFEEVRALVTSCIDGFNVCIFAYGQTGSGKTHTMEGPVEDPGINQRALLELFAETADKGDDWHFTIEVSVMEIYNETIRDLLNSDSTNKLDVKMKGEGGGYHVPGLVTKVVTSLQEVNQVFAEGRKNRATATTNMNEHSSRSHCLLCVMVSGVNRTTNSRSYGRLNLVDLAGSERVSKSGADGTRLREAQNINKSLSCLGDVIHALRVKQSHIPYRNSKLTYLLQDSLGGDSKTLMIIQVAPVEKNVSESTCSLSFGQRVRTVELGAASRKIEAGDCETKSPYTTTPSTTGGGSSTPKRTKVPNSPRSPTSSNPQTRFTPSKTSPASTRVLRHTSRR
ncbi:uncharacterized protein LOC143286194 isoform X2 [Babylonia areolata]|uniref:uncharacterized protein LOC143286194 isoform X2 n=1 Tax=Babylonia areolata TaxID=304850 RepID=UPI003FD5F5C4